MNKLKIGYIAINLKQKVKPEIVRVIAVIVFTVIYGIGVSWFLEASVYPRIQVVFQVLPN